MLGFVIRFRGLIVETKDMATVLSIVNEITESELKIGNLGGENSDTWSVRFRTTNKKFDKVITELNEHGSLELRVGSRGRKDLYFKSNESA